MDGQTNRQTHTQEYYHNPRGACVPRVKNVRLLQRCSYYPKSTVAINADLNMAQSSMLKGSTVVCCVCVCGGGGGQAASESQWS